MSGSGALSEAETRRAMATLRRAIAGQGDVVSLLEALPMLENGPSATLWAKETLRHLHGLLEPIMETVRSIERTKGGGHG